MSYEKTQKAFENVIKKPQLTEQLLSRPPFKFIVDIVSNVINSTGYLKNEFPDDEISKAGDDKNTKTAFLEKLLKVLDDGSLKNVKAAKIISGKNAEDTNLMLQILGTNASNFVTKGKTNGDRKKVKENGKASSKSKKDVASESSKSKEKPSKSTDIKKEEKKKKSSTSKERKSSDKKPKKESDEKQVDGEKPKKPKKAHSERSLKRADSMIAINGDAPATPNNDIDNPHDEGYDDQELIDPLVLNNSDNEQHTMPSVVSQPLSEPPDDSGVGESPKLLIAEDKPALIRPMTGAAGYRPMTSMGRPGTAASRPAPPKLRKKQIAAVEATPQKVAELKSEIISEYNNETEEKDENSFIIGQEEEETARPISTAEVLEEEDRGTLVQKIMDKKSEIEDGAAIEQSSDKESDRLMSVEREKARVLQVKLQDLTKSAYPLARLFDFANDDIELMVKELERWRSEQRKKELNDQNKKSAGFGDSSRLYNIIANLNKEIHEMKEELAKARGRVLKNEKRVHLFVTNI